MKQTWQLCPKCEGEKQVIDTSCTTSTMTCNACWGYGVISAETGLPPSSLDKPPEPEKYRINYAEFKPTEQKPVRWVETSERNPEKSGCYYIISTGGVMGVETYTRKKGWDSQYIKAWLENLPEYERENQSEQLQREYDRGYYAGAASVPQELNQLPDPLERDGVPFAYLEITYTAGRWNVIYEYIDGFDEAHRVNSVSLTDAVGAMLNWLKKE